MNQKKKRFDLYANLSLLLSVLFHPLFVPFYALLIYFYVSSYFFYDIERIIRLFFLSAVVLPLLLLFIFYRLKIIRSIYLYKTSSRALFTLLTSGIYFFLYKALLQVSALNFLGLFFRGIAYGLLISTFFNVFKSKISLHALSFGGVLTFFIIWSYTYKTNILDIIAFIIAMGTLVMASRIKLNAHTVAEIGLGLLAGITGQLISFYLTGP